MEPNLFDDNQDKKNKQIPLGAGLSLELFGTLGKKPTKVYLYRQGVFIKDVDLSDNVAKRLFIVDAVKLGAKKSYLAKALDISRQTIDNQLGVVEYYGKEGLIQGYKADGSKDRIKQRKLHKDELSCGNKSLKLMEIRAKEREKKLQQAETLSIPFSYGTGKTDEIEKEDLPFAEEHGWEKTRYAGTFLYFITLINQSDWLRLVMRYLGASYKIVMIFILMAANNIRSIENLKNIRSREAGLVLGIKRLASKPKVWEWFYNAARLKISGSLLTCYFRYQIKCGQAGTSTWFTDGHLLPYSGKYRVHSAYNTQRRMPVPGRTGMVTCDDSGRIVDFDIQEGKGDMRTLIAGLGKKWEGDIPLKPLQVFDREGHGAEFFASLIDAQTPFVTWEKHIDTKKLEAVEDDKFDIKFELNGKQYAVFEGEKSMVVDSKKTAETPKLPERVITLRRIYLWNKTSKRKTCGLAWTGNGDDGVKISTEECALAILSRWGASENTFKHLKDRHPWHYHPGFRMVKSERQDIANPEIKEKETLIGKLKKGLSKLYKDLSKSKEVALKNGTPPKNSKREKIKNSILEEEGKLSKLAEENKVLPERVDVSTLEDYKSFNCIDNEGKYLFDFVTISIWNARKQMVDWLSPYFKEKDELIDLFYAITNCHGWIKSSKSEVIVRLEPLQQRSRRIGQEQLCRRLTSLRVHTPNGKLLVVEVGGAPV